MHDLSLLFSYHCDLSVVSHSLDTCARFVTPLPMSLWSVSSLPSTCVSVCVRTICHSFARVTVIHLSPSLHVYLCVCVLFVTPVLLSLWSACSLSASIDVCAWFVIDVCPWFVIDVCVHDLSSTCVCAWYVIDVCAWFVTPGRSGRTNFLVQDHLFVIAIAPSRSQTFWQMRRWQLTVKDTHVPYVRGFAWSNTKLVHGCMLYTGMCQDGNSTNNQNQINRPFSLILIYLVVHCDQSGVCPPNLCFFCAVLLKSAFFWNLCVFGQIINKHIHSLTHNGSSFIHTKTVTRIIYQVKKQQKPIITKNFYTVLLSDLRKLSAFYNILQHFQC